MLRTKTLGKKKWILWAAALLAPALVHAADHGDAPNVASDSGADIADIFLFLDPNDNTRVTIIGTFHGFIVPSEAVNFGAFDENILYRFSLETTGDAKPDAFIDITFSPRVGVGTAPQTATVKLPIGGRRGTTFTAPTTPQTLNATPTTRAITDGPEGVKFFAGPADDPFFFDIPGFNRFTASVTGGSPNPALLQRGRDSFAGYNLLAIALSIPRDLIRGDPTNNTIGAFVSTSRRTENPRKDGTVRSVGRFRQVDRQGNPAVNVVLIPFSRKTEHNGGTPQDDAAGKFADSIVATLTALGTNQTNIQTLADVAITRGDYLHLNLNVPNTGPGGGGPAIVAPNPPSPPDASRLTDPAGFPNGRRLRDDTVDILTHIVTNQTITTGDNVFASDVPPIDVFPFVALPQQPRDTGVIDDNTRN
jgi:hypothetical protein